MTKQFQYEKSLPVAILILLTGNVLTLTHVCLAWSELPNWITPAGIVTVGACGSAGTEGWMEVEDSAAYAGRLADRLRKHFGRDNVFVDIDKSAPARISVRPLTDH